MENNPRPHLQEVLFGSSDKAESRRIKSFENKGYIKRIAPRIYTSNLEDTPEAIIRRNWYKIISNQYPEAILSHRSALEFAPAFGGHIFLTYTYTKNVELPGLTIHFFKGHGPIEGDKKFIDNVIVSQEARAYLENFQESRKSNTLPKTLPLQEIEEKLELILKVRNEEVLNNLRYQAKAIAPQLGMEKELKKLDNIIGALLTSRTSKILTSEVAKARVLGEPFDAARIGLFEKLYNALAIEVFPDYPDMNVPLISYQNFAFFESYFSNYIEGTTFEVDEAKQIIKTNIPLPARNEDSHDILGTYKIVSHRYEMGICPKDSSHLIDILQYRHKEILSARAYKKPGEFKDKNNMAGSTAFVDFKLVKGTLKRGFEYYQGLQHPFAKAVYMMFMITEIHPFLDGNGRMARIMMNAELSSQNKAKIIIPTVYREDYMGALKKLTRQGDTATYIKMLQKAYSFSKNIFDDNMDLMECYLKDCDAFKEPKEGQLKLISAIEFDGLKEQEIDNASGKVLKLQSLSIPGNSLSDFTIKYRIVNTMTGEEYTSPIHVYVGPYHKFLTYSKFDKQVDVPANSKLYLRLESAAIPKFNGHGRLEYIV